MPACRGTIGASALPNGRAFYRHRVRQFTTLDLTPQQVHDTGLAEVKRISAEMDGVVKESGFAGTRQEFVQFLRTDSQFYAADKEELLKETALVLKKMDGELPTLFKRLPRTPYGIREVPAYIAPRTTAAYYSSPPGDGTRAGYYYVNTHNLKSRPLYQVAALSLHEAVPGHHLQLALQQELDLPKFRRFGHTTVFIEGWALYAERLGLEVGFYEDPYSNYGRLSYEDVARLPPGRRYRHSLFRLDTQAGHRLHARTYRAEPAQCRSRSRSLHRLAWSGAGVQDGGVEDPPATQTCGITTGGEV